MDVGRTSGPPSYTPPHSTPLGGGGMMPPQSGEQRTTGLTLLLSMQKSDSGREGRPARLIDGG